MSETDIRVVERFLKGYVTVFELVVLRDQSRDSDAM